MIKTVYKESLRIHITSELLFFLMFCVVRSVVPKIDFTIEGCAPWRNDQLQQEEITRCTEWRKIEKHRNTICLIKTSII